MKPLHLTTLNHLIIMFAIGTIFAGGIFVFSFPRRVMLEHMDAERQMQAQDLEQALEWYLIQESRKGTTRTL